MARRLRCAGFVVTVLMAAACTGGGGSRPTQVSFQVSADPAEAAAYQALIDAFEATQEEIGVDLVVVGSQDDHLTKLSTGFTAGNPPDLFLVNYRRFGQFADKDVLEPLGTRLERSTDAGFTVDDLYPEAVDAFTYEGTLTCLPQNISTPVIYWNTKLFASAGLEAPAPDWTWDDLLATARALTKGDVRGLGFEPSLNRFAPFIWQAGGQIVDDLENPTAMSLLDPASVEALQFLTDLQHEHGVVPSLAEAESEDVESRFASGRLGMLIDSRRATTSLRAVPGLQWDVAPLPVHPERREAAVMLHSDAYCMANASSLKDAAMRFVTFALGSEGAPIVARTGRTVPSLRSAAESEAFLDPSQPPASARVFLDQIPAIRRFPNIASWHEIEAKADVVVEEWFFGNEPPLFLGLEIDVATLDLITAGQGQ